MKKKYTFDKYIFFGKDPSYKEVNEKISELLSNGWINVNFREKGETSSSDIMSCHSWPNQITGDRPMTNKEIKDKIIKENKELKEEKRKDLAEARKLAKKWKHKVVEA